MGFFLILCKPIWSRQCKLVESAGFKSRLSLCVDFTILVQFLSAAHVGRGAHRESKRFLQVVPISVANVINPLNPFNLLERCPCHD